MSNLRPVPSVSVLVMICLSFFLSSFPAHADALRLYVFPSRPVQMDWASPYSLMKSLGWGIVRNGSHTIGHVSVELTCGDRSELTGAIPDSKLAGGWLVFMNKIAFSVLERAWDGRLETPEEVQTAIRKAGGKTDGLSTVTFQVSHSTCERMLTFLDEYRADPRTRHYGFAPRPRYHEGSGCSAFAAVFPELGGFLSPEMNAAWLGQARVPLSLMPPYNGMTGMFVVQVLSHPDSRRWASPDEPHMNFTYYDPDKIHDWIKSYGSTDVEFDMTKVPTPTSPLFLGEPELEDAGAGTLRRPVKARADGSFDLGP